jgi:hypothetical protein
MSEKGLLHILEALNGGDLNAGRSKAIVTSFLGVDVLLQPPFLAQYPSVDDLLSGSPFSLFLTGLPRDLLYSNVLSILKTIMDIPYRHLTCM